jgi:energy-converting hydrogenase Eha subunit E
MRYVLTSAAKFKAIAITIGAVAVVGGSAVNDFYGRRLSEQIPAIVGIMISYAAFEFVVYPGRKFAGKAVGVFTAIGYIIIFVGPAVENVVIVRAIINLNS